MQKNGNNMLMKSVLGLSLGGGGAKGLFHVGAISAFERYGIKFNAVAGTSIGSIVGACYALGYSSRDMRELISELGAFKPSFYLRAKMKGISLEKLIEKVLGEKTFSDLKMPFTAVATNLDSGDYESLTSGNLCRALSASSTIVPAYRYVTIKGKRYIDGGYTNLVPVAPLKKLGIKKVLAIDLGASQKSNISGVKILDKVYPYHGVKVGCRSSEKVLADCVFEPDLSGYSMLSIKKFDYLYELGYEYAIKNIKLVQEKLKIKNIP
ncbi:MAG: patatin-like phospholipase family protein [Clostridia bacterium]|nr:patatin-like phospholipase family protein [Clostridia bacterium]